MTKYILNSGGLKNNPAKADEFSKEIVKGLGKKPNILFCHFATAPEIWEGKIIAGSSAGSDVLVKHFWACDERVIMDGLGILPIKFIPHYKSLYGQDDPRGPIDWDDAHKELESHGDNSLPVHALEEGDFIVIEQ